MKLKTHSAAAKHAQMVTAVGWTPSNKLYTCSDDQSILSWAADGSLIGKVADTEYYVTDMSLFAATKVESLAAASPTDTLVLACSDGAVRLMSSNGRVEKVAQLHQGAVTAVKWNNEGTGIATAGEDGLVTYCSAAGLLRSKLATNEQSVYALCWAPDNLSVLFSCGQFVTIKPLQASSKQTKWKAHDGAVLKADWNSVNKLIVTAGEDGRYKVWDSYGRSLFVSRIMDMPITSVSWSPNGLHFAVGSFDSITLCDKTGWVHSRDRLKSGSILSIDWTSDGTQLAAAGAAGNIIFGQIVDRKLEWGNFDVSLTDSTQAVVRDMLNDNSIVEELEFGERVVDLSIAHGHVVIATTKLCYVYSVNNFSAPHVFEVRGAVSLILQCPRCFLLVDTVQGIQIFNYEGKILCTPRRRGLLPKFLQHGNIALSNDVLAIVDRQKPNQILLLDAHTGTELREPLIHNRDAEVVTVALNQAGLVTDRKLVYIDSNRDLFMVLIQSHGVTHHKLASMVDTVIWHDSVDLLAAISDGKFLVWYYPNAVFMDAELLKLSRVSLDAGVLGKNSEFVSFSETRAVVRRSDGAAITLSVSPFPAQLHACAEKGAWSKALRLCRMIKDPTLWASLAAMAVHGHELQTAEIAFSAIDEVDKVEYLQSIMDIPTIEGRNAEIAAFCHRPDDAENILLQANLIYRAIKLNIRLFRWERALDLAVKYKTHVDTVLAYRQRFLENSGRKETINRFVQYSKEVKIDWDTIQAKKQQEYDRERAYAVPYQSAHASATIPTNPPAAYAPPTDRSRAPSSRRTSGTNNVSVPAPAPGPGRASGVASAGGRDRASPTYEVMRVSGDDVEIANGGPAEEDGDTNGWVHARDDRLGSDEFVRVDLNPNGNDGDDVGDDAAL